jgi:ribosomal protein L7/L12
MTIPIHGLSDHAALRRAYLTMAYIAAENTFDGSYVRRAMYAAMLAVELHLSPAEAAELSTQATWSDPHRSLSHAVDSLVDSARRAFDRDMDGEPHDDETAPFYTPVHVPEDVRIAASELAQNGRKIQAIKLIRNNTGIGLKEAKDIVESLVPMLPIRLHTDNNEPPF